jgi:ornithine carbamoyltransferase
MPTARPRHFLSFADWSADDLESLLALAGEMRQGSYTEKPLAGKTIAMLFLKASTRTRVSFEVGTLQLGGHAVFLAGRDIQVDRGEPIADTARVLSRYVDGMLVRMFSHRDLDDLAAHSSVPVINGLTDWLHPCQVLADVLTIRQHLGTRADLRVAWIGDGNNMANSWIEAAERFGFNLAIASPQGYDPDRRLVSRARKVANVELTRDPKEAIAGANVVNTDVWASMGQENEQAARARAFAGYRVDATLMKRAAKDAIFLHCLPAHRGEEVTASVIDGPQSRVWDQAENRLYVQKAVMATLLG